MSRWRPEGGATVLGCDASQLAGPAGVVAAPAAGWNAAAWAAAFEQLAVGRHLQLRVAPDLCRHFALAAAAGVRSLAELRELAALRAAQLFGGPPEAWAVVADWQLGGPFACAALPAPWLQGLREAAGPRRLSVVSSLLLALQRLAAGPPRSGWLGFATPQHAVLAGLQGGRLQHLHAARRPAGAGAEALAAQLAGDAARTALLAGHGAEPTVALAWPGPGAMPPSGWDATGLLPEARPDDTEAAWARRL